jgi:hypothetical protein
MIVDSLLLPWPPEHTRVLWLACDCVAPHLAEH